MIVDQNSHQSTQSTQNLEEESTKTAMEAARLLMVLIQRLVKMTQNQDPQKDSPKKVVNQWSEEIFKLLSHLKQQSQVSPQNSAMKDLTGQLESLLDEIKGQKLTANISPSSIEKKDIPVNKSEQNIEQQLKEILVEVDEKLIPEQNSPSFSSKSVELESKEINSDFWAEDKNFHVFDEKPLKTQIWEESPLLAKNNQKNLEFRYKPPSKQQKEFGETTTLLSRDSNSELKNDIPKSEWQQTLDVNSLPVLEVIENTLNDPDRVPDKSIRDRFVGLSTSLFQGIKNLAYTIKTSISQGISVLTTNTGVLAQDLERQQTISFFVNNILSTSGHTNKNGSSVFQSTNYLFARDSQGNLTIKDTSSSHRGVLFSLQEGVLIDRLQKNDLKSFAQASKVLHKLRKQRHKGVER